MEDPNASDAAAQPVERIPPKPLNERQRRILGVLIEKARTTPDAYPLSLNSLVTGCNQKSNRNPILNLTHEDVEDELIGMREMGLVAEVHGGGRVAKYRHYGYDYLGVKGAAAGVMTELLLRGEQTAGDLRGRASRFETIPDLSALQAILSELQEQQLVIALTPPGRGQMFTHNLYAPEELEAIKSQVVSGGGSSTPTPSRSSAASPPGEVEKLKTQISELQEAVQQLSDRLEKLEN